MKWHKRFFWLLLLFLPTQLGVHFWPDWAGVLGRRVDYLSPTLYLTDILIGLTIFFWLQGYANRIMNYELRSMGKTKTFFTIIHNSRFILLFLVLAAVNIFVAANQMVALYKWIKVTEFLLLGWYVVKTKPRFIAIITPLTIGVFYSSVFAIVQFFLQHSVGGPLWWLGERTFTVDTPGIARIALRGRELLRPYGTFPHPNVLGGFLAAVLPLIFMSLMSPMGQMKKRMYILSLGVGVIALFLTFSRSAIIVGAVAIAAAIARIMNYELRIMKGIRFAAVAFIGILVLFLTSYFILHDSTDESVVVRVALNDAAVHLWKTAPLFGVGMGNFLVRLPEALPLRTIYFLQPVHNIYLLLLSEIGIVGIGLIVFCIATLLNHESGIMKYGKDKTKFIIHASLFIILLLGFVDHYPLTLQQGQLLLTVLAARALLSVH